MTPSPGIDIGERLVPFVGAGLMVTIALAAAPVMPEPMTTSWGLGGPPKAHLPQLVYLGLNVAAWLFCWAWVWRSRARQVAGRWGEIGWAYTCASIILVGYMLTVAGNVGAPTWDAADPQGFGHFVRFVAASVVVYHLLGLIRRRADYRLPDPQDALADDGELPSAGLRPGERVVWTAPLRPVPGLGPLPLLAVWAASSTAQDALILLAIVALMLAQVDKLFRGRVMVDRKGVRVRTGAESATIPLGEVLAARVMWLPATAYEGGLKFERDGQDYRLRVLSAAGPALFLETTKGDVLITVPRAREAAGVINDLRRATGLSVVK